MYKNREGYNDPTAGAAFSNIIREEKKNKRRTVYKERNENGLLRESCKRDYSAGRKRLQRRIEGSEKKPGLSNSSKREKGM